MMFKAAYKPLIIFVFMLSIMTPPTFDGLSFVGPAMADDDDDRDDDRDDDDDDDDDDRDRSRGDGRSDRGSSSRGGGSFKDEVNNFLNLFKRRGVEQRPPKPAQTAGRPVPPLAKYAKNEIVTFGLNDDDLAELLAQNYTLIEDRELTGLASTRAQRLGVPEGQSLEDARALVRALPSGQAADFNHFYRADEALPTNAVALPRPSPCDGPHCVNRALVSWSLDLAKQGKCTGDVTVGMIDTGLNESHETFTKVDLTVHRLTADSADPSRAVHGTAVAALLVGAPDSRSPGLLPGARMVAVDAFHRAGRDERADVFTLIDGLSYLAEQGADVINLSLAGPPNTVLEQAITELDQTHNIVLVASAGNAGPHSDPLYPAAYEPVIAVTAVDRNNNVYRRAVQGGHIDLAAPGVEVWTAASVKGARWKTGTSFAAPYVSASAVLLLSRQPELTPTDVRTMLSEGATDLGAEGRDEVFGHGLVSFDGLCE
ncbi:S8 family serine peptidase [Aliiroseovarius sediminis]|uniref:S8 family serine peptidase n=1 Tax=Aliiroseovarius sediminis TaxID=2925839 RepID=UPI001F55DF7B|nr:S8 family serine peptidase [Aliiroseovarius sediminis]MCI2393826.1 S8 family serine peptidase [Aliiroseovarius sediminis]